MEAATPDTPTPTRVATELQRIQSLLGRAQYAAGLEAVAALLSELPPGQRDALYAQAVSQRYLGRISDALATLAELEKHHPQYARLFQERGHCYVALRSPEPAIEAFTRAVALNSALPASWRALQALYNITRQTARAIHAGQQLVNLEALPREIVTAFSMYADGEIQESEKVVRQYLLTHGNHVEGMRLLAKIGMQLDVVDDAEYLLESVLMIVPNYDAARYEYALALLQRHKHVRAREEMEILLKADPDNRVYRTTHATICTGFGDYEQALPLYRELLAEAPRDSELHLSIAHALKTLGRAPESVESYRAAVTARPNFGEAYWSLANLKTYRFTDAEIARMRGEEAAAGTPLKDRYHLCFALGKALEDRADYEPSFAYYERGNSLKKTECRYRPEMTERNARGQAEICTREFFAARRAWGAADPTPIFVVGLPRSGSTLIEQILASHSQVEGTMELADIPRLAQDLQGRDTSATPSRYPDVLAELSAADFQRLGAEYLANTRIYRSGAPFFIDKMPNNFRHLGLIHLMLPNARIIDARREPLACCFSNYKQLFASGQQFSYDFEWLARYYRMYVGLMEHWDAVLPGKILRVQHEDVVDDLEASVRRILDFCKLDFEPACVEFHKTRRPVHTASSEQVRQPINRDGVAHWRHFEPWLAPLQAALGPLEH